MQLKHIAQLQSCIKKGSIYNLPSSAQPNYYSAMLALLNLCRNCHVDNYTHLYILQRVTSIIAGLAKFESPVQFLAALDRQRFRQVLKQRVKQNKNEAILDDMILGIYPHNIITQQLRNSLTFRIDLNIVEQNQLGNKNWKMTRKIINHYYKSAPQEHKQYLQVMLGLPELRNRRQCRSVQWRSLWTQLYLMTQSILVNQSQNFQLKQIGQNYLSKLKQAIDFTFKSHCETNQQVKYRKIILKLVGLITKTFIFRKDEDDIKQFDTTFKTLNQDDFQSLSNYLISCMLIKDILLRSNLKQASDYYKEKLDKFVKQTIVSNSSNYDIVKNEKELVQLRSYLMSHQQLPQYLFENGLNFWEYELSQQDYENLAQKYLLNYSKLSENFNWSYIFNHLSVHALEKYILKAGKSWLKHKWAQHFISAVKSASSLSRNKLCYKDKSYQEMKSIFIKFGQQWDYFNKVEIYGVRRSMHEVENLLTFNFNFDKEFHVFFIFPQDQSASFVSILLNYLRVVIEENIFSEKKHIFFSSQLADNLLKIERHLLDEYWSLWADLLIMNDSTFDGLLKIELSNFGLEEQSVLQDKTSSTNDRLYLRSE